VLESRRPDIRLVVLVAAGDRPQHLYTWGSMGTVSSIGLGLALARPDRRVIALDGDGSLLMNLGALATIAACRPSNLVLLVWDNQAYATTGGQPTGTAGQADLAAVARGAGIERAVTVRTREELVSALGDSQRLAGPWVIVASVDESTPTAKPPLDCVFIKHRFMAAIGSPEGGTSGRVI
jgi:thiamine pyrophosphate-dependent acetolactate synthase large subunit-like protein